MGRYKARARGFRQRSIGAKNEGHLLTKESMQWLRTRMRNSFYKKCSIKNLLTMEPEKPGSQTIKTIRRHKPNPGPATHLEECDPYHRVIHIIDHRAAVSSRAIVTVCGSSS